MITIIIKIYFLLLIYTSNCDENLRRILNGKPPQNPRRYMAYLLKSKEAQVKYDSWLCGGVIVHPSFILTSAACIEDVQYMYAIVGYKKYVTSDQMYDDPCTKDLKKKIIMTCVPKIYDFDYENVTRWGTADIAIAKTESPISFTDDRFTSKCSYQPEKIEINYNLKYQQPGIDAMILGWGHTDKYRKENDTRDYNNEELLETSVLIVDKGVCKENWKKPWDVIIDKYMICTMGAGNLDGEGNPLRNDAKVRECQSGDPADYRCRMRSSRASTNKCSSLLRDNKNDPRIQARVEECYKKMGLRADQRNGFCQNDHGGPLVSWVGSKLTVLGVQSIFLLKENYECTGPFMYTSTHCNGAFLDCVINDGRRFGTDCNAKPEVKGFKIMKKEISWKNHTDGPATNELRYRPMKDISL